MQHLHPRVASIFSNFSWADAVVATISDASFCQEQDQLDGVSELQVTISVHHSTGTG